MDGTTGGRCQSSYATGGRYYDTIREILTRPAMMYVESASDYLPSEETGSDRDEDV